MNTVRMIESRASVKARQVSMIHTTSPEVAHLNPEIYSISIQGHTKAACEKLSINHGRLSAF